MWRRCYPLPMPLRVCTVSFKSPTGITHGVDVEAETLYEAAGLGLARLKKDGWIEGLGPGSTAGDSRPGAVDDPQPHRAAAPSLD